MFNYYRMLKNGLFLIMIPPILVGVIALVVTKYWITSTYEASVSIVVENKVVENTSRYEDILASQALAKNIIIIAQSSEIKRTVVAAAAEAEVSEKVLTDSSHIELQNNSNIVAVTVKDTNPVRVAKLANLYGETLMKRAPEYVKNANLMILDKAVVPEIPDGPNMLLNVVGGFMLGFIGGLISAYVAEFMRMNNPKYAR